jgi:serine/threonine protein kinase
MRRDTGAIRRFSIRVYSAVPMPLSAGDKLGPYEILALMGVGGMGEVYRAHDTRLRRDVAIQVTAK